MKLKISRGPVPLFHQIAEAIRYRIATGRLSPGDRLPSVRQAATLWGVNLHTVRRAYGVLSSERLVETRSGDGTRVLPGANPGTSDRLEKFLQRTLDEAQSEHHLSPAALAEKIRAWSSDDELRILHVLECSAHQAIGHAREVESRWRVQASPWVLDERTELPDGDLVATYFHYSEIQGRWPERLVDIQFVPIQPDPSLIDSLSSYADGSVVRVCEFEAAKAYQIAADLRAMLPERLLLEPMVIERGSVPPIGDESGPVLLAPRVWGSFGPEQHSDSRLYEVRYVIAAEALLELGRRFRWSATC